MSADRAVSSPLLAAGEAPPVVEDNDGGRSDYLLICDHYGRKSPNALGDLGVAAGEFERHIAWDIGIAGVAHHLAAALDAHLIAQRYSRLVIDCNRPLDAPSSIPLVSEATPVPGNQGLAPADRAARAEAIFAPYHRRIAATLDARARDRRPTILIALHSFTPVYAGIARPWHIGTLYNRHTRLPAIVRDLLCEERGLVVGDNQPYAVSDVTDYSIPVHGEARGLPHTGIEIRQDLIADADGQRQWAERLARVFRAARPQLSQQDTPSAKVESGVVPDRAPD